MDIAVILPTYNERENIPHVLRSLAAALEGLRWEAIIVDDDSPDGTAEVAADHARTMPNVRLIRRLGRRGLATACIEGMMATQAPYLVVMDADMQHDERVLPQMLERLHREALDVVVGTRNDKGGSMGSFSPARVLLSRAGQAISKAVCRTPLTDPMSGFFALRRDFLMEVVHDMQGSGFKVLVDLLSSARRPVRVAEVGYTFRARRHGESKLDLLVGVEYVTMVLNKLLGGVLPVALLLYVLVGGAALTVHVFALLLLVHGAGLHFATAQGLAAMLAVALTFWMNNRITFRDRRMRGARTLLGAVQFATVCSLGWWVGELVAQTLLRDGLAGAASGAAGAVVCCVWSLSIGSQFTWSMRPRRLSAAPGTYQRAVEAHR